MKLADSQGRWKLDAIIVWTPVLVRRLEASEDKITCTVDHWLDCIIGGFVTELEVKTQLAIMRQRDDFYKDCEVIT